MEIIANCSLNEGYENINAYSGQKNKNMRNTLNA